MPDLTPEPRPAAAARARRPSLAHLVIALLLPPLTALLTVEWLSSKAVESAPWIAAGASLGVASLVLGWLRGRLVSPLEELNRAHDRLAESHARAAAERDHLQAIAVSMSEALLVIDEKGRALLTNGAFRRLFSIDGETRGRTVGELLGLDELTELTAAVLESRETRRAQVESRASPRRSLVVTASPVEPAAGAVVTVDDVTEFVRLSEVRRDLVANVSHEIKTPLAAIRGYAETLRDGALEDRSAALGFLDRLLDQCQRLQAILEDLLTLSRLDSPEAVRRREELDLQDLLAWAADQLDDQAAQRRVELRVEPGPPRPFRGEREALERLLLNLLDNAIKYNRPGGRVVIGLVGDDRLTIEVSDTGIGIPPEVTSRVFERFYRVDTARSRSEGGTGLGLAIVKHAVRLHGGRIEVESLPGKGSTFRAILPSPADSPTDLQS